ncbi:hypothetical protein OH76DRAFT_98985 [Lentinus brumalis]|uniref:Uncharacterized protein n=1 Tax=Lentinus brumalis TaxID=2498619 RepID=A0A371CQE1_9APHY|nr:hypothetical protein OH76DRAFT_98985 [Polyporus brumalis]
MGKCKVIGVVTRTSLRIPALHASSCSSRGDAMCSAGGLGQQQRIHAPIEPTQTDCFDQERSTDPHNHLSDTKLTSRYRHGSVSSSVPFYLSFGTRQDRAYNVWSSRLVWLRAVMRPATRSLRGGPRCPYMAIFSQTWRNTVNAKPQPEFRKTEAWEVPALTCVRMLSPTRIQCTSEANAIVSTFPRAAVLTPLRSHRSPKVVERVSSIATLRRRGRPWASCFSPSTSPNHETRRGDGHMIEGRRGTAGRRAWSSMNSCRHDLGMTGGT